MKKARLLAMACVVSCALFGQWNNDPSLGIPVLINNESSRQFDDLACIPDSSGGSIVLITFYHEEDDAYKTYAQKLNVDGTIAWGGLQSPLLLNPGYHVTASSYFVKPSGDGGAFLCWVDLSAPLDDRDLRVLYVDKNGTFPWGPHGKRVTNRPTINHEVYDVYPDGHGGVLVCWSTNNLVDSINMYVQRYNQLGEPLWTPGGIEVCESPGFRQGRVVHDGNGGAIVFFNDTRNDPKGLIYDSCTGGYFTSRNLDVFAQRISASGNLLWQPDGVPVATGPELQYVNINSLVPDLNGGAIVAYHGRLHSNDGFRLQRINGDGVLLWPPGGVLPTTQVLRQNLNRLLADGSGGVTALFNKHHNGNTLKYLQRFRPDGSTAFSDTGLLLTRVNTLSQANVVADLHGNIFYSKPGIENSKNVIRVFCIDSLGMEKWGDQGILATDFSPTTLANLAPSGKGEVIVFWLDTRGIGDHLYANKIQNDGMLTKVYVSKSNGSWNSPTTWQGDAVPPIGARVIIKHSVTVEAHVTCKYLKLQGGGNMVVNPGILINVAEE